MWIFLQRVYVASFVGKFTSVPLWVLSKEFGGDGSSLVAIFQKKKKKKGKKKTLNIAHVTRMSFSDIYCLLHSLLVLVIEKPADKFLDHVWMEKRLKWRWDAYCGNVRRRDGERGFSTPVENKTPQKKISTDTFDFRRFPKGPATCIHFRPWPP